MKDATGSTDGGLIALAVHPRASARSLATRVAHDPAVERAPRAATGRFRRTETAAEPRSRRSATPALHRLIVAELHELL